MAEEIRESREEELERIRKIEASSEYQEKLQILLYRPFFIPYYCKNNKGKE